MRVKITVTCEAEKHEVGVWFDRIEEKYPFYCDQCGDDLRQSGSWPWVLTTEVVDV